MKFSPIMYRILHGAAGSFIDNGIKWSPGVQHGISWLLNFYVALVCVGVLALQIMNAFSFFARLVGNFQRDQWFPALRSS